MVDLFWPYFLTICLQENRQPYFFHDNRYLISSNLFQFLTKYYKGGYYKVMNETLSYLPVSEEDLQTFLFFYYELFGLFL